MFTKMATTISSPLAIANFEWPDAYAQNTISLTKQVRMTTEVGKYFDFTFKAESVRNENEPEKVKLSVTNFKANFHDSTQYYMCIEHFGIKIQSTYMAYNQKLILNMKTARFYPNQNGTTFISNHLSLNDGINALSYHDVTTSATATLKVTIHQPCQSFKPSMDQDVEKLCFDEELSDIKIVCDGETFPCHKFMLGARSDVFKAMLTESPTFRENQEGLLTIEDTTAETMKSFLYFLYTDTVPPQEMTGSLLILADKYNVTRLADVCSRQIMSNINVDNVLELLYTSYLINDDKLLDAASKFMGEHRGKIVKGPFWNDMQAKNPGIAAKIIEKIFFKDE